MSGYAYEISLRLTGPQVDAICKGLRSVAWGHPSAEGLMCLVTALNEALARAKDATAKAAFDQLANERAARSWDPPAPPPGGKERA